MHSHLVKYDNIKTGDPTTQICQDNFMLRISPKSSKLIFYSMGLVYNAFNTTKRRMVG
jgi:hypothetical protein